MFATQNASFKHPPLQILDKILDKKGKLSYHAPSLWICFTPRNNSREDIFNSLDETTSCRYPRKLHMDLV